jgi:hypothetical protein
MVKSVAFRKKYTFFNRMNFEDKTLRMSITNPEIRNEFDYETKGVLFLLPIETSGSGLTTIRKFLFSYPERNALTR